ncbi:MAG: glycosyltransferase family 9 protein [Chloroflexaceae bacterium]|nr:glycosyltransferase family 9 protein [Chloroflexaceae bacterium]
MRLSLLHLVAQAEPLLVQRPRIDPPQRILVIKPDHLGDVLLATPALHRLRLCYPHATIVALVGPWSAMMLAGNPDIDRRLTLPFPGFHRSQQQAGPHLQPVLLLLRYALLLRRNRFDLALLFRDDHWWGALLALLAGIPRREGYAVPPCRPFLTRSLRWLPAEHVTEQALALVDPATPPDVQMHPLHFKPTQTDIDWLQRWLIEQRIPPAQPLVVIHAGTGGMTKLWLAERWAMVADALSEQLDVRIVLTGTAAEAPMVQHLTTAMHAEPLLLIGTTSIGQLAALCQRASLVMGVDSGPLHLAVSQRTPTIHLYGPSDAGRFGPWGPTERHVVVRSGLWCSPCGVFDTCPRGTSPAECMEHIQPDSVFQLALGLLRQSTVSASNV